MELRSRRETAVAFTPGLSATPSGESVASAGTITGGGTPGTLPLWASDTELGDSGWSQDAGALYADRNVEVTGSVTAGDFLGEGGALTFSGLTPGTLPKTHTDGTLVDSLLSESGSTVSMTGTFSATTLVFGATPALSGVIRLTYGQTIAWRNLSDTTDYTFGLDSTGFIASTQISATRLVLVDTFGSNPALRVTALGATSHAIIKLDSSGGVYQSNVQFWGGGTHYWTTFVRASDGLYQWYNAPADTIFLTLSGAGQLKNLATTDATSTSTGTIVTAGGIGVAKTIYCGTSVIAPLLDSGVAADLLLKRNAITQLTLGSLLATFAGAVRTAAPTTGTAANWKLGSRVAATVALDTTQYIELDVGGTLYKIGVVT